MRVLEGEDSTRTWLEGLAANEPLTYANNNAVVEAVAAALQRFATAAAGSVA